MEGCEAQAQKQYNYLFMCESCLLGVHKCNWCLKGSYQAKLSESQEKKQDKLVRCRVRNCNRYYHEESCVPKVREAAESAKGDKFICAAHFCTGCKEPFKKCEKVARCVRCYKAYHQFEFKPDAENLESIEDDIKSARQQCYAFEHCIPISMDRFVCKEHLVEDTKLQSDAKNETLLSWQVLKSLHN